MLDIETGVAEARTLHPSSDGWFAIFRKNVGTARTSDRSFPMGSLDTVVRALDKVPDAYVSQASFIRASRKVANFKSINCAFVDIDCYSGEHNSPIVVPDEAFIERLHEHARSAGIPTPSYTTLSGRGVYCKWIFDRPLSAHQLIRWKALKSVLVPLYAAFGVDAKVKDAARVLRVMGSAHGGTGSIVRVGSNTHQVHNFDALCTAAASIDISRLVMPSSDGASAVRNAKNRVRRIKLNSENLTELNQDTEGDLQILRHYGASRTPVMLSPTGRNLVSLAWGRFVDLRTLAEARGGIHVGSRDIMMFWMATTLAHAGVVTSENMNTEIGEMIGAFSGPNFDPIGDRAMMSLVERLKEKEAGRVVHFKGGSYDPLYTPTNDHLIDVLSITQDEQQLLTTIIGGREKLRRADSKVEGRADRRQHRIEWRGLAVQMKAEALAAGETRFVTRIADELKVQRSEVSRLLSGKLDRDPTAVETRGRKKISQSGSMIKIVVARHGGLSRSIWLTEAAAADPAVRHAAIEASSRPASSSPVQPNCAEYLNRGIFSLTRKREEKKEALARKTKLEVFQAGGPQANQKSAIQAATASQNHRNQTPEIHPAEGSGQAGVWAGWSRLVKLSAARTRNRINGKRQSNTAPIKSEGRVTIKRANGTTKSIPILSVASIIVMQNAGAPSPYVNKKTAKVDPHLMRAAAVRIQAERDLSAAQARFRDAEIAKAESAQQVLASVNHIKAIRKRNRAMAQADAAEAADAKKET